MTLVGSHFGQVWKKFVNDFSFLFFRSGCSSEDERIQQCCAAFRERLKELNHNKYQVIYGHLECAVNCVTSGMRYERVQHDGPKLREVTKRNPLSHR